MFLNKIRPSENRTNFNRTYHTKPVDIPICLFFGSEELIGNDAVFPSKRKKAENSAVNAYILWMR
jgi:hypothetical protein